MQPQDIKKKIGRFRILIVGRANAGKTTLLQRVCNTTENPEVFDGAGNKVNTILPSVQHQNHLLINPIRSMAPLWNHPSMYVRTHAKDRS